MLFKAPLKRLVGRSASRELMEKLTEYAIAETEDSMSLAAAETIDTGGTGWDEIVLRGREELWRRTFAHARNPDLLLLEFGVHRGESMRYFANLNTSPRSRFIGFDSFEGLPEVWRGTSREHFDVQGRPPQIADERVSFVKGWFRDTLPGELDALADHAKDRAPVVHFDADLYSSTLYLLFALGQRFGRYHFIFDEFSGHETRALFNYMQATGAKADFLHRVDWEGFPQVVSGELVVP